MLRIGAGLWGLVLMLAPLQAQSLVPNWSAEFSWLGVMPHGPPDVVGLLHVHRRGIEPSTVELLSFFQPVPERHVEVEIKVMELVVALESEAPEYVEVRMFTPGLYGPWVCGLAQPNAMLHMEYPITLARSYQGGRPTQWFCEVRDPEAQPWELGPRIEWVFFVGRVSRSHFP